MLRGYVLGLVIASVVGSGICGSLEEPFNGYAVQGEGEGRGTVGAGVAGSFLPLGSLDMLDEEVFTTIGHPAYPNHGVRIKKTRWCDDTVNAYTGYIDIQARHFFFYFFESRRNPETDDVIYWTNGGPGCTSSVALFMELGPCRILDAEGPKYHPESWNSNANIFFVDHPIGVGFSYAEYGEEVATTEEAANDIAAFIVIFFEHFTNFKGRAFHMAGESYGGRFVPVFASTLYDQNARLVQEGITPINLTSIMIGNGLTDVYTMLPAYSKFPCTHASVPPFFSINDCVSLNKKVPRCQKWLKSACQDHFDAIDCNAANQFCRDVVGPPFIMSGKNPYDVTKDCSIQELEDSLCYPVLNNQA
ncbi:hypothetical protein ONZ45_g11285 [Pleurotus djamor]|nr:hypothetical protein ONZ45_g11285 [Pleurotus djamor]